VRALATRLLVCVLALTQSSCSTVWRARFVPPEQRASIKSEDAPFLKVHTHDGSVYVLRDFRLDEAQRKVRGNGIAYDATRKPVRRGALEVSYAEVALLETNRPETVSHMGLLVLGIVTGASLLLTAACLTNPKACFGSCPTFYAYDGVGQSIQAEGFSSSIAHALEATDVDPLYTAAPAEGHFELVMTNEALETHAVRSVRVLAAPRDPGTRVLHAGEAFYQVSAAAAPVACSSLLGDCAPQLAAVDEQQYLSPTDPADLATKETLELRFAALPRGKGGRTGLVVIGRMGLVTTFLLYQALAYMGRDAGERMAALEHGAEQPVDAARALRSLLGGVELEVLTAERGWVAAGEFYEMGPIAREAQLLLLPEDLPEGELHVRARMSRGSWKLDQVALVHVDRQVEPVAVPLQSVQRDGQVDAAALALLRDGSSHLVTYPGDRYTFGFELPGGEQELFLESRGFYYEWIRKQWLPEQSSLELARLLLDPRGALRRLAPRYKQLEASMEQTFWQSRIGGHR
jgi:hypothetical protein